MRHHPSPLRGVLAAAALATVVLAWSPGCDTGYTSDDCAAAMAACGSVDLGEFCRASPSACVAGGQPYHDTQEGLYLYPNQTLTVDLSPLALRESVDELWFGMCNYYVATIDDFVIRLDGADTSYSGKESYYRFPGHTGPARKLEITWKGTTGGLPYASICVWLELNDAECIDRVNGRECYEFYHGTE